MKQKYVKPRMIVERFVLTQSIASGCGAPAGGSSLGKPTHATKETCGWDVNGVVLFLQSPICVETVGVNDQVEGYCYNNPDGGTSIFASF